jgi:hypothetical protein
MSEPEENEEGEEVTEITLHSYVDDRDVLGVPTDRLAITKHLNVLEMKLLISTVLAVFSAYISLTLCIYFLIALFMKAPDRLLFIYLISFLLCLFTSIFSFDIRHWQREEKDHWTLLEPLGIYSHQPEVADFLLMEQIIGTDPEVFDRKLNEIEKKVKFWDLSNRQGALKKQMESTPEKNQIDNVLKRGDRPDEAIHWIMLKNTTSITTYVFLPEAFIMRANLFPLTTMDPSLHVLDYSEHIERISDTHFNGTISEDYLIFSSEFYLPREIDNKLLQAVKDHLYISLPRVIDKIIASRVHCYEEFKINEYLNLKLVGSGIESKKTNIYVNGEKFMQCKYLLLNVPKEEVEKTYNYKSIDEAAEVYSHEHEDREDLIDPETEFFGHCSNLEAWAENNYNTNLLHRNLAFPLLKKLTEAGDRKARKVFKDEIAKRIIEGDKKGRQYLIENGYLSYLMPEEIEAIAEQGFLTPFETVKDKIEEFIFQMRKRHRVEETTLIINTPFSIIKHFYPSIKKITSTDDLSDIGEGDMIYISEHLFTKSEQNRRTLRAMESYLHTARHLELIIFLPASPPPDGIFPLIEINIEKPHILIINQTLPEQDDGYRLIYVDDQGYSWDGDYNQR